MNLHTGRLQTTTVPLKDDEHFSGPPPTDDLPAGLWIVRRDSTWRQLTAAGAAGHAVEPGGDPLGVGAGEQLFGRLAKLQDLCQHGDSLIGVLDASQRSRTPVKHSRFFLGISDGLPVLPFTVNAALVSERVEDWREKQQIPQRPRSRRERLMLQTAVTVVRGDGFAASLLVAKHQVDPLVEALRHKLTLQGRAVFLEEIAEI